MGVDSSIPGNVVHPKLGEGPIFLAIQMVIGPNLQDIYNTALYLYATTGNVAEAYSKELIENAFASKPVGGMRGNI
jgi:hypothetical protein